MFAVIRSRRWLAVLVLLASVGACAADCPLTIIDLQHRFPDEVVSVLEPLVGVDGSIVGANNALFVRASPQALAAIRQALERIDSAAQNLIVEVRRAGQRSGKARGGGVYVDERVGEHGRIRIGQPPEGSRRYPAGSGAWIGSGSYRSDSDVLQRLRVLDGQQGFIAVGDEHPVPYRERYDDGYRSVTRGGVGYRATGSGFYVRPRVQGDRVRIDIDSGSAEPGPGGIARTSVQSSVSGRLGQWIELGGASGSHSGRHSGVMAQGGARGKRWDGLEVRVSVAR